MSESLEFWKKIMDSEEKFVKSIMNTQDFLLSCLDRKLCESSQSKIDDAAQKFSKNGERDDPT
jgi:hypothetical protein